MLIGIITGVVVLAAGAKLIDEFGSYAEEVNPYNSEQEVNK